MFNADAYIERGKNAVQFLYVGECGDEMVFTCHFNREYPENFADLCIKPTTIRCNSSGCEASILSSASHVIFKLSDVKHCLARFSVPISECRVALSELSKKLNCISL